MLNIESIKATTLSDAWFQTVYRCVEKGKPFKIDTGSFAGQKRLEFDYIIIQIEKPWLDMLPHLNPMLNIPDPVADDYLDSYLPYLMTSEEKKGEAYTYGQRICRSEFFFSEEVHIKDSKLLINDSAVYNSAIIVEKEGFVDLLTDRYFLNQMELMIWTYKNKGYRNNQMILQVSQPSDMLLKDPPCLRHIDTRIQDGKLHFFPYFRSWDLWGGFPANLAAIEMMKQYCAAEIGVNNGEIIASSKGLHLYDYTWCLSEVVRGMRIEDFRK